MEARLRGEYSRGPFARAPLLNLVLPPFPPPPAEQDAHLSTIEGGVDRLHEMAKDMRTETHQHNVSVEPRTARAREWGC